MGRVPTSQCSEHALQYAASAHRRRPTPMPFRVSLSDHARRITPRDGFLLLRAVYGVSNSHSAGLNSFQYPTWFIFSASPHRRPCTHPTYSQIVNLQGKKSQGQPLRGYGVAHKPMKHNGDDNHDPRH